MPQEKKTERERRKYLKPKKYEVFKKNKAARIREYRLKKKMISEQLQVSNATSTSETLPPKSSAFSTQQILSQSVHETEKSLPSSQQKKAEMLGRGGSIYV